MGRDSKGIKELKRCCRFYQGEEEREKVLKELKTEFEEDHRKYLKKIEERQKIKDEKAKRISTKKCSTESASSKKSQ